LGGLNQKFPSSSGVADATPEPFGFAAVANATPGASYQSNTVTITGINVSAPVTVQGGEYRIGNGGFTSAPGEIANNQALTLRATAPSANSTTAEAVVSVGGVNAIYAVRTLDDTTVDAFLFNPVSNVNPGSQHLSQTVTISGISVPVPISVTGGEYSIDENGFTGAAGQISNGQRLTLRATASQEHSTTFEAAVTVGNVSAVYSLRTVDDTSVDSFSFDAVTDAELGSQRLSNIVTISGISVPVPISVTGGEYAVDGGDFTSEAGEVGADQTVTLRVTASDVHSTTVEAVVTVGDVAAAFAVRTADDVAADSFSFTSVVDAEFGSEQISETVTVTGTSVPVPISIAGGEYAVDGGEFTSEAGEISHGQTLTLRGVAPDQTNETTTVEVVVGEGEHQFATTFVIATVVDETAPQATIKFPPPVSLTEGDTVLVRGTAQDDYNSITSLRVNGIEVQDDAGNGFATWQVEVPLTPGSDNTITVAVSDTVGNTDDAAQVMVRQGILTDAFPDRENEFPAVVDIAVDRVNGRNRALVTTNSTSVMAVDLDSGARTILVDIGGGRELLWAIALHDANDEVFVSGAHSNVFRISLSDPTSWTEVVHEAIGNDASITFDDMDDSPRVVTAFYDDGRVSIADPELSNFSVLSDSNAGIPNHDDPLGPVIGMDLDRSFSRYLIAGVDEQAVFAVDRESGVRSIVSGNGVGQGEMFGSTGNGDLAGIAVDGVNHRVLVTEIRSGRLFGVDLLTGDREIISSPGHPSADNTMVETYNLAIVEEDGYALVTDFYFNGLFAVDLVTGHRVIFSKSYTDR
jgi:hypothetical protein